MNHQTPTAMSLDEPQRAAASHAGGPAVVIAGPGAGKTRTLVGRHLHLHRAGIRREAILVTTFTVKAADQLRARIAEAHGGIPPQEAAQMAVGTFHSIAARMLRRFAAAADLSPKFRILDIQGQIQLLNTAGIRWESSDGGDLLDLIGRWKDSRKTPGDAAAEAGVKGDRALADAADCYARYEEALAKEGAVDFADLIGKMMLAMNRQPAIARTLQNRYTHLLVDEFQDTNPLQMAFLKGLLGRNDNVWAVGDDDQAIYGWRGADVRHVVHFGQHFPNASVYRLPVNWRSDVRIVDASAAFVAGNKIRVRKNLSAPKGAVSAVPDAVRIRGFETETDEARWVARACKAIIARGASPSDLAVLFRTASLAPLLDRIFAQEGVPAVVQGASPFWDLPEARLVAGLLAMAENRHDTAMIHEVVGPGRRRQEFEAWAHHMRGTPFRELAPAAGRVVAEYPPPGQSSERLGLWLDASEQAADEAARFRDLRSFLEHVAYQRATPQRGVVDGVSLSTIHASKGLEWAGVFVVGAESHMMPHHRTADIEEERRVLYVGMTRARAFLSLTYARQRFARAQGPSVFLHEIVDRLAQTAPQDAREMWPGRPPKPTLSEDWS